MAWREIQINSKKSANEIDNEDNVDVLLANVDQFIENIYRDMNMSPPLRSRTINSRNGSNQLSDSSSDTTCNNENTSVVSPSWRDMEADVAEINRICDNVDQDLRSIGLFINTTAPNETSEPRPNTSLRNSCQPVSIITENCSISQNSQRRRSSPILVADSVIDLSNSQIELDEVNRQPIRRSNQNDDEDDDVILVSDNIPPVVDLCTPSNHQPRCSLNAEQFSRRRLHSFDMGNEADPSCLGPLPKTRPSSFRALKQSSSVSEKTLEQNASEGPSFICAICMESFVRRQPTSTFCGHIFCKDCIERALQVTPKCPLCKKKITKNKMFRIYF